MADKFKAKSKVDHPEAQFDKPKEVVQDKTLSRHEQKKRSIRGSRTSDNY